MKAGFLWGKTVAIYLQNAADYAIDSQAVQTALGQLQNDYLDSSSIMATVVMEPVGNYEHFNN